MAFVAEDRVREGSTTTGTGALSLGGAVSGYRAFSSVMSNGDTCQYAVWLDAEWETGIGTYNSSGNTLSRTTVLSSSNSGNAVSFSAGTKQVVITLGARPHLGHPVVVPAGTASLPAVTTHGDVNTGIVFSAPDAVGVTTGGTQRLTVDTAAITSTLPAVLPAGAAGTPSVTTSGDLNTGVFFPAADQVALAAGGVQGIRAEAAAVTALLPVVHPAGAVGTPSVTASGDLDTGAWFPAANTMAVSTGGVEALRVTSGQAVIVGNGDTVASPAAAVVRGADATGSNVAASNMTLRAGLATGNAASGALVLQTGAVGSSGSTLQTATERVRVNASGELIVGNGDAVASPASATIRGTDGSGTNIAGGNVTIQAGRGTGTGAGGSILFATSPAGSSGSTLQTATEIGRFTPEQNLHLGWQSGLGANVKLKVSGTLSVESGNTNANCVTAECTANSGHTGTCRSFTSSVYTPASLSLANWIHYYAWNVGLGSSSTVTNIFGFHAESTVTQATNNYGFYGNIASGTGRWNFYAAGTADNYFAGNVGIGVPPSSSVRLDVSGGSSGTSRVQFAVGGSSAVVFYVDYTSASWVAVSHKAASHDFFCGGSRRVMIDSSGFTQFSSNLVMPYQPAHSLKNNGSNWTLTAAEMLTGIVEYQGGATIMSFPAGSAIEGALTWSANNVCLDLFIINNGSNTLSFSANGNTFIGKTSLTIGQAALFRIRRTAANTFTIYRAAG